MAAGTRHGRMYVHDSRGDRGHRDGATMTVLEAHMLGGDTLTELLRLDDMNYTARRLDIYGNVIEVQRGMQVRVSSIYDRWIRNERSKA